MKVFRRTHLGTLFGVLFIFGCVHRPTTSASLGNGRLPLVWNKPLIPPMFYEHGKVNVGSFKESSKDDRPLILIGYNLCWINVDTGESQSIKIDGGDRTNYTFKTFPKKDGNYKATVTARYEIESDVDETHFAVEVKNGKLKFVRGGGGSLNPNQPTQLNGSINH